MVADSVLKALLDSSKDILDYHIIGHTTWYARKDNKRNSKETFEYYCNLQEGLHNVLEAFDMHKRTERMVIMETGGMIPDDEITEVTE